LFTAGAGGGARARRAGGWARPGRRNSLIDAPRTEEEGDEVDDREKLHDGEEDQWMNSVA
jgi:hypothetical protein